MDAKEFTAQKIILGEHAVDTYEQHYEIMEEYASYKLQEQRNRHLIIGILSGLFVVVSCFIGAFIVTSL